MPDAWNTALSLLARRALSAHEVKVRLQRAGFSLPEIEAAMEKLAGRKFVDDRALAYNLAACRAEERRRGPQRVRTELLARGLDPGLVDEAVQAAFPAEKDDETARAVLRRFLHDGPLPQDRRSRDRLARRLLRQGFAMAVVRKLIVDSGADSPAGQDGSWGEDDAI